MASDASAPILKKNRCPPGESVFNNYSIRLIKKTLNTLAAPIERVWPRASVFGTLDASVN